MTEKMVVIYIEQTGHVVGAVSRTADPNGQLKLPDSPGASVLVSNLNTIAPGVGGGEEFNVPASTLKVSSPVNLDANVFAAPTNYSVDSGVPEKLGSPIDADFTATLKTTAVEIAATAALGAAAFDAAVWVQVQESSPPPGVPPDTRVATGTIKTGDTTRDIELTILPGGHAASITSGKAYSVLLLIAGYLPYVTTATP